MDNTTALSLGRVALGAVAWTTPRLALKSMLLEPEDPQAPFLVRLFGARDVAMGVLTLLAPAEARRVLLEVGVAVDASDAVAALLATRGGALRPLPATLIATTATAAAVMGAAAVRSGR